MNSQISDYEHLLNTMMQLGKLFSQHTHTTKEESVATMLQFSTLNFIEEHPNIIVSDLVKPLGLSKSSATQLIERLVKLGLVERTSDKEDRRITRLEITKKGKVEKNILKKTMVEKMKKIFSKVPARDLREVIRVHNNLITQLQNE